MCVGCTPFDGDTADEVLRSILRYPELLHYPGPEVMSPVAWDLISRYAPALCSDGVASGAHMCGILVRGRLVCGPETRLGFEGVQRHPFFHGIDWDNLRALTPPFVPVVRPTALHPVSASFDLLTNDRRGDDVMMWGSWRTNLIPATLTAWSAELDTTTNRQP